MHDSGPDTANVAFFLFATHMDGNIPLRLNARIEDKFTLSVSPLDICLCYWAKFCLGEIEDVEDELEEVEAISFALTALLNDYQSIYCHSFQEFSRLFQVRWCSLTVYANMSSKMLVG